MDNEEENETMQEPDSTIPDIPLVEEEEGRNSKTSNDEKKNSKGRGSFAEKHQQLFLVEFLIDSVTIDSCAVDEEILDGQTCLTLMFLNFPPMEICEKDFDPNKESARDKVKFNCGKSLMFAFNEKQCDHPPPLAVEITVSKKLGDEKNPFRVDIGTIKICVSELFRQIVDIAKYKPDRLPASKSIKDCFMLIGPGKRTMGEVNIYIRFSCLGQNVVTEFQCGTNMKTSPFMFKNREGKKVFELTGNEMQRNDGPLCGTMVVGSTAKGKSGCGCLRPTLNHSQTFRGGQGDGERSSPPVVGTYAKGNKVVLDLLDKKTELQTKTYDHDKNCGSCPGSEENRTDDKASKVNVNPDQNCFILKFGDKGQIPDRGKMILEFRTPKQKIPPKILPPYHEDIGVQTDSTKKGKKKGKKK